MNAVKSFLDAHQNAEEMTEADVTELKSLQEKLTQSAQKVFARCMSRHRRTGAAGAGPDMGNMGGAGSTGSTGAANDDVVDADFKEVYLTEAAAFTKKPECVTIFQRSV